MRHTEILETERQTADLRQKLLNEELNHRVKNILSLITSLVSQPVEELVEDQLVIAIDVETMLAGADAASIDTAGTAAEALRVLAATSPDVCVLDVNLGTGTSLPVADELLRRGIPFIFATGYADRVIIPPRMTEVGVIRKPYDADALTAALAQALAGGSARAEEGSD